MRFAGWLLGLLLLALPAVLVSSWLGDAADRLRELEATPSPKAAVAAPANEGYCTPQLQGILRRVLQSCGLIGANGGRGCKPLEARQVATMGGADFNALFLPMAKRGGIVQFEAASSMLDDRDRALVDRLYADRRGASYFFVVARASPDGPPTQNRELSHQRAEAVMGYLQQTFHDPELDRQVGLLWLGEEYAQLEASYCEWQRSGTAEQCRPEDINRSAFITWIDCAL